MAIFVNLPHNLGVFHRLNPENKENRLDIALSESFKNQRRGLRMRAVIERQNGTPAATQQLQQLRPAEITADLCQIIVENHVFGVSILRNLRLLSRVLPTDSDRIHVERRGSHTCNRHGESQKQTSDQSLETMKFVHNILSIGRRFADF